MRFSSKIVGAGLILSGTVLAGCNCCDSNRRTASSPNAGSSPYLASKQQSGQTNWGAQPGQPSLGPVVRTGAAGQPVYATQAWNNTPAAAAGGTASGDMTARTNSPAIPATSSAGTSNHGGYGAPSTTAGNSNAQPATPSYGSRTTASPAAYTASPGSSGAYRSATGMGGYGATSPTYGSGSSISPVGGSAVNSTGPSNAPIYTVPGSRSTAPSADSTAPSNTSNSTSGSSSGTPTDTGSGTRN